MKKKKYYIAVQNVDGTFTRKEVPAYIDGGILGGLKANIFSGLDPAVLKSLGLDGGLKGGALGTSDEDQTAMLQSIESLLGGTNGASSGMMSSKFNGIDDVVANQANIPGGVNVGSGVAAAITSLGELKSEDGKLDTTDIGQVAGDAITGSSQLGQIGKQAGQLVTGVIGQDATTQTLGEGVDYQKSGITAMNKALEYGAAGAQYGGPVGAIAGTVVGGALGLVQGNKRKKAAMEEFLKRRGERIDNFDQQSELQYSDQYLNQALYAKKGGSTQQPIHINPENKGKFTNYCKSKGFDSVTSECIELGKKSVNPLTRKRATFAKNARKFNR